MVLALFKHFKMPIVTTNWQLYHVPFICHAFASRKERSEIIARDKPFHPAVCHGPHTRPRCWSVFYTHSALLWRPKMLWGLFPFRKHSPRAFVSIDPTKVARVDDPWPSHLSFRDWGIPLRYWYQRVWLQPVPKPRPLCGHGQQLLVRSKCNNLLVFIKDSVWNGRGI